LNTTDRRRWGSALAGLVIAALAGWALWPAPSPPEPPAPVLVADPFVPSAPAPAQAPPQTTTVDFTPEGVPIRPAGSAPVDAHGMAPHAITPRHQRIYRENSLIGDLNGAMEVKDAPGMRRLLQQYRDEYPEDANVLQDGYALIASCFEALTSETRAAAQRYYDEQLDSGLRRYIRRHCLEAPSR
jgi:hypothetical protein